MQGAYDNCVNQMSAFENYGKGLLRTAESAIGVLVEMSDENFQTLLDTLGAVVTTIDSEVTDDVAEMLADPCLQGLIPESLQNIVGTVTDFASLPAIMQNKFLKNAKDAYSDLLSVILSATMGQAMMLVKTYEDWISSTIGPVLDKVDFYYSCLTTTCGQSPTNYGNTFRSTLSLSGNYTFNTSKFSDWNGDPDVQSQLSTLWSTVKSKADAVRSLTF